MGGVQSRPDPSRSMEVISIGFSRTGTVSMQMALTELLQGPVVHGATHVFSGGDSWTKVGLDAMLAKRHGDHERCLKLTKQLFDGFAGCSDHPGLFLLPELMELYPDARVVLVTRDPQRWWKSMEHVMGVSLEGWAMTIPRITPGLRFYPDYAIEYCKHIDMLIGKTPENGKPYGPEILELHNKMVVETVPKDKLLVFDLKQGWEPLCEFLGKAVPNMPFPRANDATAADEFARKMFVKLITGWTTLLVGVMCASYFGWRYVQGWGLL